MSPKELRDNVSRTKASAVIGKSIFIGLRAADALWQYNLLHQGWGLQLIKRLGGHGMANTQVLNPQAFAGLQPYYGLVSLLSLGSGVKQIAHMMLVSEQYMSAGSGVTIAAFNTIINTLNTIFSLWTITSPAPIASQSNQLLDILSSPILVIGLSAYVIGLATEAISEFQRKAFKKDPANKGKPYGGGLFSLATNINYGGYTIWRSAYALFCGGPLWATFVFGFFFYDFASRGVPVMDQYLTQRYGNSYREIKSRRKYSLIPGIY